MYEDKTYSSILQDALQEISAGVQTGEGYLTYNALSALAYELQKLYIQLDYISRQSHADTADLDELVEIAKDRGIYQKKATSAYVSVRATLLSRSGQDSRLNPLTTVLSRQSTRTHIHINLHVRRPARDRIT